MIQVGVHVNTSFLPAANDSSPINLKLYNILVLLQYLLGWYLIGNYNFMFNPFMVYMFYPFFNTYDLDIFVGFLQ